MGHLGLTPQSISNLEPIPFVQKEEEEADKLIEDAQLLEDWAVLL
jgi:3-methyl-2-oxobutanoate hydroxymethyltransferase